jgi:hypothetical protein
MAMHDFLASHPGARISLARVKPVVCKAKVPGTWEIKHSVTLRGGAIALLFFSDSCVVEARAYV